MSTVPARSAGVGASVVAGAAGLVAGTAAAGRGPALAALLVAIGAVSGLRAERTD
jgi:hypothetical protein